MNQNRLQIPFFYILLIVVGILVFAIFFPYMQALFLAIVFSVIFQPVYKVLKKLLFGFEGGAALGTVLVTFFLIVVPLSIMSFFVFNEAKGIYDYYTDEDGMIVLIQKAEIVHGYLIKILPDRLIPETSTDEVQIVFDKVYEWLSANFSGFFSNILTLGINAFIFVLGMYFFLRDGHRFKEIVINISPLQNSYDEKLLTRMSEAVNSIVRGSLFIALIQGLLTAGGLYIFGVSSPLLWGSVAVIVSLIPSVGTMIVLLPAVLYVLFNQGLFMALGLGAWSVLVVGMSDNILRPYLIEKGIKVHPFLILLSVFGGIGLFGAMGFIIGPIVLSLLFALIDIHTDVVKPSMYRSDRSDRVEHKVERTVDSIKE